MNGTKSRSAGILSKTFKAILDFCVTTKAVNASKAKYTGMIKNPAPGRKKTSAKLMMSHKNKWRNQMIHGYFSLGEKMVKGETYGKSKCHKCCNIIMTVVGKAIE